MLEVWVDTYKKNGFQKKKNEDTSIVAENVEIVHVNVQDNKNNIRKRKDRKKVEPNSYLRLFNNNPTTVRELNGKAAKEKNSHAANGDNPSNNNQNINELAKNRRKRIRLKNSEGVLNKQDIELEGGTNKSQAVHNNTNITVHTVNISNGSNNEEELINDNCSEEDNNLVDKTRNSQDCDNNTELGVTTENHEEVRIELTHKQKGNKSSKLRRENKRKSLLSQQDDS